MRLKIPNNFAGGQPKNKIPTKDANFRLTERPIWSQSWKRFCNEYAARSCIKLFRSINILCQCYGMNTGLLRSYLLPPVQPHRWGFQSVWLYPRGWIAHQPPRFHYVAMKKCSEASHCPGTTAYDIFISKPLAVINSAEAFKDLRATAQGTSIATSSPLTGSKLAI